MHVKREKLPRAEIERLCLEVLRSSFGLHDTQDIIVGATRNLHPPTWDIVQIVPAPSPALLENALSEIRRLQRTYDLLPET